MPGSRALVRSQFLQAMRLMAAWGLEHRHGLNSPAGPVMALAWTGLRQAVSLPTAHGPHKPDGTAKRLVSRYYQLKAGHARTGQYLNWAKVRPTAQCW